MEKIEEKRYVQRLLPHHGFQYTGTGMKMQWITFITFGGDGDKTPSKLTKAPHYICKNCPKNVGPISKIRMFIRRERRAGGGPGSGSCSPAIRHARTCSGRGLHQTDRCLGQISPGVLPAGRSPAGGATDRRKNAGRAACHLLWQGRRIPAGILPVFGKSVP